MDLLERYSFKVHTFGCKVNTYDSGLLQKDLVGSGLKESKNSSVNHVKQSPDIHILNTCAVTAEATKGAVKEIRRIKSTDPLSTIVVTGCAAQVDTGVFDKLPGADLVIANSHKSKMAEILDQHFAGTLKERVFKSNIFRKEDLGLGGGIESSHTRSFLKIQDGCNSFCTYCVIPFGRGKSRSVEPDEIVRRIKKIELLGIKEVVLTGVHIADYSSSYRGEKIELYELIKLVLEKTSIPRIRLTSLEPKELSEEILDLFKDKRLCRHFHMSIQSATDKTLLGMKRRYTAADVKESLELIAKKVPGSFVGMDVIVGFPGESEEDFLFTMKVLEETPWSKIHVFPYSQRPGTKAQVMEGQIPHAEIKRRAKVMRSLSSLRLKHEQEKQIGGIKEVLLLQKEKNGWSYGLSRDYWSVKIEKDQLTADKQVNKEFLIKVKAGSPEESLELHGELL